MQAKSEYAAGAMLNIALSFLWTDQEFITNIKEMAFSTNNSMPRPTFYSNAEESDNRVWLHCVHSQGNWFTALTQIFII